MRGTIPGLHSPVPIAGQLPGIYQDDEFTRQFTGGMDDVLSGRRAAFVANPEVYEFLEAEGASYTIRLPANQVLQDKIGHLLKRPVGRPRICCIGGKGRAV